MEEMPFTWPGRRPGKRGHDMAAAFLVMDIQKSPAWAKDLLDQIGAVKAGRIPCWERIGNAYRLLLTPQGAVIEDLVDEGQPPARIPLQDFEKAAKAWKEAVSQSNH